MTRYKSKNRHKYLLQFHIIFVCKYRKALLSNKKISDYIKILSKEICLKNGITIKYMEKIQQLFNAFLTCKKRHFGQMDILFRQ